ncbi:efflux RND transporter permease subunit [Thiocapsa roseopersicina]|uniref:Multidrug efflux pump subunit AcrB n=1 Tax=Thiocapsa roseopersicina TaxID=1058 RepID=A0A1H2X4Z7_THIRO|nr:efflux RND transporter permease subunit [Thiocapsa roseopersicina]SDW87895.1 Multidrug efflux pump subunit AcrB [Thiocapsa roseopersicina]
MVDPIAPPPPESAPSSWADASLPLGLAGRIARTFINTPVTPMLLFGALFLGILGLLFTPRQEDPQISVPMIDIFVQYPGASAGQVERLVTDPLERIMKEIKGVRHVYSATQRGVAMVTVRFEVGEEMGASIVKVHDKLQSNMDRMPPDVQMPLVKPVGVDDVPVVTLTLWSEDVEDHQLRKLGLDLLQAVGSLPDAGKGFVVGGREDQIRVEVLMERLAGHGITLDRIANTIRTANSEQTTGVSESGDTAFNVYSGSFLRNAEDVGRLVIGNRGDYPLYLRDIATVEHVPQDTKQIVNHFTGPAYAGEHRADGAQAVTVAIAKKQGTNGVTVARQILGKVEELKTTLIPSNVHVEVTRDYGKSANDKVNELLQAMFEAAVIVAILCLIGLGARAAFVVITVIPVVILLTIWWAWMVDYTIDRVSLFALIFAIGILVDDATVVVENIFRHWLESGKTTIETAVRAVDEVGNPTILATFTIIAALLPMGWVSGLMGPYMRPIPVLGSSAMFFSLVAAFVFTPWFALRVRPRLAALEKAERREEQTRRWVSAVYRPLVMPLIRNRAVGIAFLVGTILTTAGVCVLFYTQTVPVKMLPFDNKPEFSVVVNMPEGTALPVTANVVHRLAEKVRTMPEVTAVQTYVGTAQPFNFNGMVRHYYLRERPWEGDLLVMLKDKNERALGSHALAVAAREMLTPLAHELGARIAVVEMPPGPPVLQTVVAEVYGPDAETRRRVAADLTGIFEQVEGIVDVDSYMAEPYSYWRFEVDAEKAVRMGISVDAINRNLAMAMGGFKLGDVKRGVVQEPTFIVLQIPLASRAEIGSLASLPIQSEMGGQVPLGELGCFVQQQEDPVIYHKDLRPMEYVVGEMQGRLGAPIYGMLDVEDRLEDYRAPDGVQISGMPRGLIGPPLTDRQSGFEWSGEWTVTYETFRDMGLAFIAALILIYGLIVWEFRNFKIAGLIMSPIPLTLIGIVPGHLFMGAEFTATSMIGLIALGGIIVRQSILIVEFVKLEVAKGKTVKDAAVAGAEIRMRPILITSLTLMAGAWAIIEDPIFQGMAVSLLFGAGVATLMAVIVIPLGCISLCREFYLMETPSGERALSASYCEIEGVPMPDPPAPRAARARPAGGTPLLLRLWSALVGVVFGVIEGVGRLLGWLRQRRSGRSGQAFDSASGSVTNAAVAQTDTASGGSVAESRAEPAPRAASVKRSSAAARKPARAPRKAATKAVADNATTVKKPRARRATKKTADKPEDS